MKMEMRGRVRDMSEQKSEHTPTPWVVQQLNHVDGELWLQIGWFENGHGVGPICEMVGGAVTPLRSFKAVVEFKYLVAPDAEVRANADFIARACNSHDALVGACRTIKAHLSRLESDTDEADPLRTVRKRFHQPLHDALDAALALANAEMK